MSARTDKILDLIDGGLQSSPEPVFVPVAADRCARCSRRDPDDGSEFCGPCRSFLLGDTPDPDQPAKFADASPTVASYQTAWDSVRDVINTPLAELRERFAGFGVFAYRTDVVESEAVLPRWRTVTVARDNYLNDRDVLRIEVSWSSLDPAYRDVLDRDGHGYPLDPNDPDYD